MKKHILLITAAAAILCAGNIEAQSNIETNTPSFPTLYGGVSEIYQAVADSTNWDAGGGYGHSVTGTGKNIAFVDIIYNFAQNIAGTPFGTGAILGFDTLWSRHHNIVNSVSGGVSVNAQIAPLAFTGVPFLQTFVLTVSAGEAMATPKGNNPIGAINIESLTWSAYNFYNFTLNVSGIYENRTGQSQWDGNYLMAAVFIQRNF